LNGEKTQPHQHSNFFCEIKNGHYPIFPSFVPKGDLWGARGNQRNRKVP